MVPAYLPSQPSSILLKIILPLLVYTLKLVNVFTYPFSTILNTSLCPSLLGVKALGIWNTGEDLGVITTIIGDELALVHPFKVSVA